MYVIRGDFKHQFNVGYYPVWYSKAGLFSANREKALVLEDAAEAQTLCIKLNRSHATCRVVRLEERL